MQRERKKKPERRNFLNTISKYFSNDTGESLFTVRLTPERESVHAVQSTFPFKTSAAMKITGVPEVDLQIDTGATCDVVKLNTIKGAKYILDRIMPTNQVFKVYNSSTLRPFGKCKTQVTTPFDRRGLSPLEKTSVVSIRSEVEQPSRCN